MNRPFNVTITLWMVLLFAVWNGVRAWTGFSWQDTLTEFSAMPGAWYLIISGIIWFLIGIWLWWRLVTRNPKAWIHLLVAAAVYTVWIWSDRLFLQTPRENWPFTLTVNILLLVFIVFTSNSLKREAYERSSKKQEVE